MCFACDQIGEQLITCEHSSCGKFFHSECAKKLPNFKFDGTNKLGPVCPLHVCANCDLEETPRSQLVRCIRCPVAYHEACIPAGCDRKERSRLLCPRHTPVTRHSNSNCCLICGAGGELVCCDTCPGAYHIDCLKSSELLSVTGDGSDGSTWNCHECIGGTKCMPGQVVWGKVGAHRWWPAQIKDVDSDEIPENVMNLSHEPWQFPVIFFGTHDWYWLGHESIIAFVAGDEKGKFTQTKMKPAFVTAVQEAHAAYLLFTQQREETCSELKGKVVEKPASFQKIRSNLYTIPKPPHQETPDCGCSMKKDSEDRHCGELCLNRLTFTECDIKTCPAGQDCRNRRLQKREYPKLIPYKTDSCGWGLKLGQDIHAGECV